MAFLQAEQLEALAIEKMIFHVIGPDKNELLLLEEINPGPFSDFFLNRIRSVNDGIMFDFIGGSGVLTSLRSITADQTSFSRESKQLATLFKQHHGGNTSKGVFLMFLLSAGRDRFHALIKYDHQTVLSYEIEDRENAHYALLQQLQDTFVQSPEALQKSAIIGLTDAGGALCVRDRGKPKGITHYFRAFLGAQRRYTEGDLTNQLAEITQAVAKQYSDDLSTEVKKALRQRLYDTLQTHSGFDPGESESFLTAVYGPLPEDSRIRVAFNRQLRARHIDGEAFDFDKQTFQAPRRRRIVTQEGIQVIFDREYEQSVQVEDLPENRKKITITTGGINEDAYISDNNTR